MTTCNCSGACRNGGGCGGGISPVDSFAIGNSLLSNYIHTNFPTNYEKVKIFHETFGHPVADKPTLTPYNDEVKDATLLQLRLDLIDEERGELGDAITDNDIVGVADALSDLLYVVYGAGLVWGINLDATFAEIQRSNMSKLGADGKPILRQDGKILKGENYTPPNLKPILFG